jgi:hypothetical protein
MPAADDDHGYEELVEMRQRPAYQVPSSEEAISYSEQGQVQSTA